MTADEWDQYSLPHKLVRSLPDAAHSERIRRLVLCAIARRLLTNEQDLTRIKTVELFADGMVNRSELMKVNDSARVRCRSMRAGSGVFEIGPANGIRMDGYSALLSATRESLSLESLAITLFNLFSAGSGESATLNCFIVRDIFGNPFRPVSFSPEWRTSTAVAIAKGMYESRDFGPMPLLADALQDAGCEVPEIIDHCRGPGPHVRGCWVVDGVLGKT